MDRLNSGRTISRAIFGLILVGWLAEPVTAQKAWDSGKLLMARVKYAGGGDWYNDPSAVPNLMQFLNENTTIACATEDRYVELGSDALFSFPILFITGHGRISITDDEAERLRLYLYSGGFLLADDDYGMDASFREIMQRVCPGKEWVELPFSHPVFHQLYDFPGGVPKIHEHDGGPGKTFGLFHEGRLIALYTFNTNISDGWADPDVHNDPEPVRQSALRMGANIVLYAMTR